MGLGVGLAEEQPDPTPINARPASSLATGWISRFVIEGFVHVNVA
jgi:hypothetical protein